jgi:hypothetical protein
VGSSPTALTPVNHWWEYFGGSTFEFQALM